MAPNIDYLENEKLSDNPKKAKKIRKKAAWYCYFKEDDTIEGTRDPYWSVWQKKSYYILEEIHEGDSWSHVWGECY